MRARVWWTRDREERNLPWHGQRPQTQMTVSAVHAVCDASAVCDVCGVRVACSVHAVCTVTAASAVTAVAVLVVQRIVQRVVESQTREDAGRAWVVMLPERQQCQPVTVLAGVTARGSS